jgi:hypothetical protein
MLNKNKVYYSLRQREKCGGIQLLEHVDSVSGLFVKPIAIVFPWRAEMIRKFVERLSQKEIGEEMRLNTEDALRVLVAMKLATSIRERTRIEEAFENLYSLSDEETSFWAWKILTYKNKGASAFKAMYLRK